MLIHPLPDPIAFSLGPLAVRWYGLMYLAAFAQFILLGRQRLKQKHIAQLGFTHARLDDMLFYGVLGVIVGGRLGEVLFYHPIYYFQNPLEIFAVWHGGMSFHGGFLGVITAMWFWSRKSSISFWASMDFIAPLVPLGYAFGRIGNFINAELPGRVADPNLPWAMIWPNVDALPRHPSPIYQAVIDGLLLFVLLWWFARTARPRMAISALFCIGYGCARIFTEAFRTPDFVLDLGFFSISSGQLYSLPMVIFGGALWYWSQRVSTMRSKTVAHSKQASKRRS